MSSRHGGRKKRQGDRLVAENRKARREIEVEQTIEAGLVLHGSEVKSLREGKASLNDSYAREEGGELYLINANISAYDGAHSRNHRPQQKRKLLLHRSEINKLAAAVQRGGKTLLALKIYFNKAGRAKVLLGLGKGRKLVDKRQVEKARDWARDKARLLKNKK